MPVPSSGGQFGGWGQNPNWGGNMPDNNYPVPSAPPPGQPYRVGDSRAVARDPYSDYDERRFWRSEIHRLEQELAEWSKRGYHSGTAAKIDSIKSALKEARLNLARLGEGDQRPPGGGSQYGGIDLSQLQGMGQGAGGMSPEDFMKWMDRFMAKSAGWKSKYGNEADVPEMWSPEQAAVPESKIDPMAVIRSAKPRLEEEMQRSMAGAAQRLGNMGALMGSGYAKELGKAGRKSTADLAEIMNKYLFESGENQASREQQAQQAALDRSLSSWGTHGGWQMDQGRQWESQWPMLLQMFGNMLPGISWR